MNKSQKEAAKYIIAGVILCLVLVTLGYVVGRSGLNAIVNSAETLSSASMASMANFPETEKSVAAEPVAEEVEDQEEVVASEPAEVTEVEEPELQPAAVSFETVNDDVVNYDNSNSSSMSYTCPAGVFGVTISMDPGTVMGMSTEGDGAAVGIECEPGRIITVSTPHYQKDGDDKFVHWQVHVTAYYNAETEDLIRVTEQLAIDDVKPLAVFFPLEGNHQILNP